MMQGRGFHPNPLFGSDPIVVIDMVIAAVMIMMMMAFPLVVVLRPIDTAARDNHTHVKIWINGWNGMFDPIRILGPVDRT